MDDTVTKWTEYGSMAVALKNRMAIMITEGKHKNTAQRTLHMNMNKEKN